MPSLGREQAREVQKAIDEIKTYEKVSRFSCPSRFNRVWLSPGFVEVSKVSPDPEPIVATPTVIEQKDLPRFSHCSHIENVIRHEYVTGVINKIIELLREYQIDFDTIAHRGISGAMIAPVIAYLMNKEQIVVRKNQGNGTASSRWVEGYVHAKKFIVIDDLVSSGRSFEDTVFAVHALTRGNAEFQGLVLYDAGVRVIKPDEYVLEYWLKRARRRWKDNEHSRYYF